jgi:DHA1 family tetracycline resistance protein-like MFS transporter
MRKGSLLTIFLVVFIDLVGFGIVIPILPYYAQQYGASAWTLGWLMTTYSLMQFLVSPIWGRLSDRIGRRPVLLGSILGTAVSMVALGLAPNLMWLFIARTFAGICAANISTAYAYIADVTTEENRAKGMGAIGAAFGLGFIFGPAIGGVLSKYGYSMPMFAGAALAAINLLFAFFKLEEPPLSEEARSANRSKRFDLNNIRSVMSDPRTKLAIGLFFLVTFAVTQMEVIFAIYLKALFGLDAQHAGGLLALMGVIMVGIQGGAIGKLAKRFGEVKLIIFGTAICSVALIGFGSVAALSSVIVALCLLALGHGILHPSLSSLASKGAAADRRGATMGVFQSAGSLARVAGPPCAGILYDRINPSAPFFSGAVVLAVAFVIILSSSRKSQVIAASVS